MVTVAPLARVAAEKRVRGQPSRIRNINRNPDENRVRGHLLRTQTYRTPPYAYEALLDYRPEWFHGRGSDPSAGDGRMLAEIVARGNEGPHWVNDIRAEERSALLAKLPSSATITISDYLRLPDPPKADFLITNPPFTLAMNFVEKARTHVRGPICILQSVAWQGTNKRSEQLRRAGLAYVLNLPRRPKWEVDVGTAHSNIWDFAWFVFLSNHGELPQMDWLQC